MKPDEPTIQRLRNLAAVGEMLYEVSNDNSEETYFLAKSSLNAYEKGLRNLELEPKIMDGMLKLVQYLGNKIEKRKRQAGGEFSND